VEVYAKAFQITSVEEKSGIDEFAAMDLNLYMLKWTW
jgi:hypothetical protein